MRHEEDSLMHFGVLGMKWGVHRQKKKLAKAKAKLRKEKARRKKMKKIKQAVKYNNSSSSMKTAHVVGKRLKTAGAFYGLALGSALLSAAVTKRMLKKGRMVAAIKSHAYGKTIVKSAKFLSLLYVGDAALATILGPLGSGRMAYDQLYKHREEQARKKGLIK